MYDGIVLAGGYSSRFNQNKMCALFQGQALILHTIKTMHKVCEKIYVVTGYYHQEISHVLKGYEYVEIVFNKNYDQGMFSSVKTGAHQVNHDFFIIPGDYPLVSVDTYKALILGSKDIRVPSYNKHLGHPLFLKYDLKNALLDTTETSLKEFRNIQDLEIINVDDEYILFDIDKVEDLNKIKGRDD
ncbi:MAG: nucleotidyltransferase family protein [Candidatus Izemoplasmatales bacterium]|nr:nucleotidyltransferase family protein [Candidatus Izemoplasmatales bacterium]